MFKVLYTVSNSTEFTIFWRKSLQRTHAQVIFVRSFSRPANYVSLGSRPGEERVWHARNALFVIIPCPIVVSSPSSRRGPPPFRDHLFNLDPFSRRHRTRRPILLFVMHIAHCSLLIVFFSSGLC